MKDEVSGLAAPCDKPEALLDAGVRLATDPDLRARLRLAGRRAVEAQSWETVIARFEGNLEDEAGMMRAPAGGSPVLV
jgi:glycosyltransferase involved in cell wall biosynthesis